MIFFNLELYNIDCLELQKKIEKEVLQLRGVSNSYCPSNRQTVTT